MQRTGDMEVWVDTKELTKALYHAASVAEKRSQGNLAHVTLLANERDQLSLFATDREISFLIHLRAQVQKPGKTAVHAKNALDLCKTLADGSVHLSHQPPHWLHFQLHNTKAKLLCLTDNEILSPVNYDLSEAFTVNAKEFCRAVDRTLSSVVTSENRYNLPGIFMEFPQSGILRLVATDGHRLALADCSGDGSLHFQGGIMVPKKCMVELKRLLGNGQDDALTITRKEGVVVFHKGQSVLDTRLLSTPFPNYRQLIPSKAQYEVVLSTQALTTALRRVAVFAEKHDTHGVLFVFSPQQLSLKAEDPESGSAEEILPIEYAGTTLQIGYNAFYVLDFLGLMQTDQVIWRFSDALSPAVLEPVGPMQEPSVKAPTRKKTSLQPLARAQNSDALPMLVPTDIGSILMQADKPVQKSFLAVVMPLKM